MLNYYTPKIQNALFADDVVGVVTFMRHGKKQKRSGVDDLKQKLTPLGERQSKQSGVYFKAAYNSNLSEDVYLAAISSGIPRADKTTALKISAEERFNKPVKVDARLNYEVNGHDFVNVFDEFEERWGKNGEVAASDWYIQSSYSKGLALKLANILADQVEVMDRVNDKYGRRSQIIAGTHSGIPESLFAQIAINNGKTGFDSVSDFGGFLKFNEPLHMLYKNNGSYQIAFRDKVYDVDMSKLKELQN